MELGEKLGTTIDEFGVVHTYSYQTHNKHVANAMVMNRSCDVCGLKATDKKFLIARDGFPSYFIGLVDWEKQIFQLDKIFCSCKCGHEHYKKSSVDIEEGVG